MAHTMAFGFLAGAVDQLALGEVSGLLPSAAEVAARARHATEFDRQRQAHLL